MRRAMFKGESFGRLVFICLNDTPNKFGHKRAWFECTCGELLLTEYHSAVSGRVRSCGCLNREVARARSRSTPPALKHGMCGTGAWKSYMKARQRCNNPKNKSYRDYGGRGIKFLFSTFESFHKELGPRPVGMSLDRINNGGNYEPGNVRWATCSEQSFNRRGWKWQK